MKKILVLLAVPILSMALSGCVLKKKDTAETSTTSQGSATTQLTTTQATTQTTEFLDRLSKAVTRAKQDFKDDAALAAIEVMAPADLDINLAKERFIFASPTDDNWLYILAYDAQTQKIERSFTFMQDYMGGADKPKTLDASSVKKGWAEAILTAQGQGSTSAASSGSASSPTTSSTAGSSAQYSWISIELITSAATNQAVWSITFEGASPKTSEVNASTGALEGAAATSTPSTATPPASSGSTAAPSTTSSDTTGSTPSSTSGQAGTTTTPSSSSSSSSDTGSSNITQ